MVKPIKPSEVVQSKEEILPDGVLEVFNQLIAERWDGYESSFKLKEVLGLVATKLQIDEGTILKKKWLDVEDVYRKAGWNVVYDQPAYNESYDASFSFRKKK